MQTPIKPISAERASHLIISHSMWFWDLTEWQYNKVQTALKNQSLKLSLCSNPRCSNRFSKLYPSWILITSFCFYSAYKILLVQFWIISSTHFNLYQIFCLHHHLLFWIRSFKNLSSSDSSFFPGISNKVFILVSTGHYYNGVMQLGSNTFQA